MPTIQRIGPYRLFFYSADGIEPKHIHIERDRRVAKFWLDPIRLERSGGFNRAELRAIEQTVTKHQFELIEAWHDYFGN